MATAIFVAVKRPSEAVIAAASVAGSFLGSRAMGSLDAFAVLALLSFVACLASSIIILWRHALVFAYNGAPLLAVADELGDDDVRHAYRVANVWMQPDLNRNGTTIANLSSWFSASCVTLAAEVLLWTVSIAR